MLKNETISALKEVFNADNIEIVNMDLIRVHINERGNKVFLRTILSILKENKETGPLKLHEEAAKSFNCLYYIDIIQI